MTQAERRKFLIQYLLDEALYKQKIPQNEDEQKQLFRSLVNVRPAKPVSKEFLLIQDEYLKEENKNRGITDVRDLKPVTLTILNEQASAKPNMIVYNALSDIFLWRGDITTLKVDAIVNAANSGMTGCWQPCHACIDNCIHTFAGIQLRSICTDIMKKQGHEEPTGSAKITPAFNLPSKFVLHTVGPIIYEKLTQKDCDLLASCYKSCLNLANENKLKSIAFCCISTGVFRFPAEKAAQIAINTVCEWKKQKKSDIKVVFNVFGEKDESIYKQTLTTFVQE